MDSLRIRWGSDVIIVTDAFALNSIARASANFDEGKFPLPFELTPGLFAQEDHSSQPFARKAPIPGQFCDTTHRLIFDLTGLEFPAAVRLKSSSGVAEDLVAIRAWMRTKPGADEGIEFVLDGYLLSATHEMGHRYHAVLTGDVAEIEYRNIDGTFSRIRPRVSAGWRAVSREVTWPLTAEEQTKAHQPRTYKKAELQFSSVAPKILHQALRVLHERGAGTSRELAMALGVPEKQAVSFWKGLIADGIFEKDGSGNWVLNPRSQVDIEKRKPTPIKRKEAAALIEQLVKNAEAINKLPDGESSIYITGLEVLGSYLDINLEHFDYLYVAWRAEMRRSSKWPYIPDLEDPETGFEAMTAKLSPKDKRLRLLDDAEVANVECPRLSFFKFKTPEAPPESTPSKILVNS